MSVLIDTSVLGRLADANDPDFATAENAVRTLHRQGVVMYLTPQNLIEFRNFATRPKAANGLGLSPTDAAIKARGFEAAFAMLPDIPDIYPTWCVIVDTLGVVGKQVHDARLVAVCHAHAVSQLLTFNVGHFARLATAPPGLIVLDPATV